MFKSKKIATIACAAALVSMLSVGAFAAENTQTISVTKLSAITKSIPATKTTEAILADGKIKMEKLDFSERREIIKLYNIQSVSDDKTMKLTPSTPAQGGEKTEIQSDRVIPAAKLVPSTTVK